jgi:hypothetical protein
MNKVEELNKIVLDRGLNVTKFQGYTPQGNPIPVGVHPEIQASREVAYKKMNEFSEKMDGYASGFEKIRSSKNEIQENIDIDSKNLKEAKQELDEVFNFFS